MRLYSCVQCPQRAEEGIRSPEAGVTVSCELPSMGAGNQTWDLYKSSMGPQSLSRLISPSLSLISSPTFYNVLLGKWVLSFVIIGFGRGWRHVSGGFIVCSLFPEKSQFSYQVAGYLHTSSNRNFTLPSNLIGSEIVLFNVKII